MDWLKEMLKDMPNAAALEKSITENIGKNFVSKADFNSVNATKKQLEEDVKTRDTQLEELKKTAGSNEDLKKQIETLQGENKKKDEEYQTQLKDLTLTNAIKMALNGKVHDESIVTGLLDKTKLVVDGEKVIGLDDQLKSLKESKAFLFSEDTNPGGTGGKGNQNRQTDPNNNAEGTFGKRLAETAVNEDKAVQESTKHYF